MNKAIWKYQFSAVNTPTKFKMSRDAIIRHVGLQGEHVCLWAEVTPDINGDVAVRTFILIGTGWEDITPKHVYIGTVITPPELGGFVWHIFEVV